MDERQVTPMFDPAIIAVAAVYHYLKKKHARSRVRREILPPRRARPFGRKKRKRVRRSVAQIYNQLGPAYFRRAYRMTYESFSKLVDKLVPFLPQSEIRMARVNGYICNTVRVAVALRYFAGGSPYDIATTYGISVSEVFVSVWRVVNAVNQCPEFNIEYPRSHDKQLEIAQAFQKVSGADFDCCAGAIDGMLIWIHKPSQACCREASCQDGKFLCGRKNKFGLNLQAVADVKGRFLDISIVYPGSTSDCLAFEGMDLYNHLENGILHGNLCLFGDNAYVNTPYMATPFLSANQIQDTYNFFHSQLRIRVECAFGMLTERWSILRRIMPKQITVKKTIAMVICLAKLHNFCIDERDKQHQMYAPDEANIELFGAVPLQTVQHSGLQRVPVQLLDGGNHFDDVTPAGRRRRQRVGRNNAQVPLPREQMLEKVSLLGVRRPSSQPMR